MGRSGKVSILGMAGSLRRESYNKAALRAALAFCPDGSSLEIFDLRGIPPFDQDREQEPPERVSQLKSRVRSSDAVLFVTPEYNYSFSGVIKNAVDWGSRPYGDNCWGGKPAAVMGASTGLLGTARAQYHLRQVLLGVNMLVLARPEVMISDAPSRFDAQGNLQDEKVAERIRKLMQALVAWSLKLGGS